MLPAGYAAANSPPATSSASAARTAGEAKAQAEVEGQRPPMTAAEAVAEAKAEGLTLARSRIQESGFRNVSLRPENRTKWCPVLGSWMNNPNPRPYSANFKRFGKQIHLGCFATAEEAALHVARTPEKREAASLPPPMTAAGAMAEAEAEGLTLARADNQSGFRSVHVHNCHSYTLSKPYEARAPPYGYFATAEEASLQIARTTEASTPAAAAVGTNTGHRGGVAIVHTPQPSHHAPQPSHHAVAAWNARGRPKQAMQEQQQQQQQLQQQQAQTSAAVSGEASGAGSALSTPRIPEASAATAASGASAAASSTTCSISTPRSSGWAALPSDLQAHVFTYLTVRRSNPNPNPNP